MQPTAVRLGTFSLIECRPLLAPTCFSCRLGRSSCRLSQGVRITALESRARTARPGMQLQRMLHAAALGDLKSATEMLRRYFSHCSDCKERPGARNMSAQRTCRRWHGLSLDRGT